MQARSLGFYVRQMQRGNRNGRAAMSADDCLNAAGHYHEFLAPYEAEILEKADDVGLQVLPLAEINLPAEAYIQIVDQIYAGVSVDQLLVPYPAPAHINAPEDPNNNCFTRYIASLHGDNRTCTAVNRIMERTNSILASRTAGEQRISGLVVGRVQSGKTRNYIGLMLKAVSEGWNIVIVLTSSNKALGKQTKERIQEELATSEVITGIPVNFMDQAAPNAANIRNNNFFWGTEIKQVSHLDGIIRWFRNNEAYQRDMRVLIIDDEADNASPEANAGQDLWDEDEINEKVEIISEQNQLLGSWFREIEDTALSEDQEELLNSIINNGTAEQKQQHLLADPTLAEILYLNSFRDEEENIVNIRGEINTFFDRSNGQGALSIRRHVTFIKLVRSIFAVRAGKSAINSRIRQIIDRLDNASGYEFNFAKCAYVGYTATPYACIFNRCPGETPLFPDFIYSLEKSPEHFGLQEIFGSDLQIDQPRMNIVTVLTQEDQLIYDNLPTAEFSDLPQNAPAQQGDEEITSARFLLNRDTLEFRYIPGAAAADENNDDEDTEEVTGVWQSLKKAIAWAFCTAAARRWRHQTYEPERGRRDDCWTTMILNISPRQEIHEKLQNIVAEYLRFQLSQQNRPGFIEECRTVWQEQTTKFTGQNFHTLFMRDATPYPQWNDVESDLPHFFDSIHHQVIQINSTQAGKTGQSNYWDENEGETVEAENERRKEHDKLWIVCGGNTISRGLTLSGLTVSYFDRVEKTTAVDTFTQMGRWFGYRRGYELLPRIWMPADTIQEYKRAALCEDKMHNDLEEAFAAGKQPADGENFMTFYCWSRKLSLRAFAFRTLTDTVAMTASSNWISTKREHAEGVLHLISEFLSRQSNANHFMDNSNTKFPNNPAWTNVPAQDLKAFLSRISHYYPVESQRMLRGLMSEIDREPVAWDVVCGSETSQQDGYPLWGNHNVALGNPRAAWSETRDVAKFNGARTNTSFFAMIDESVINKVDCKFLKEAKRPILAAIQERIDTLGHIPYSLDRELPEGDNLETRFDRLIEQLEADYSVAMTETVHGLLRGNSALDGYRNRSSHDYQLEVYHEANHDRPTLQIYLIHAPEDAHLNLPLVSVSFFWPDHQPDQFFEISTGLPPSITATPTELFAAIKEVLEANGAPLRVSRLRAEITINKLQGRCSEAFFTQNIMRGVEQGLYGKFPNKEAYYPLTWATSDEAAIQKRDNDFFNTAYDILKERGTSIDAKDLRREVAQKFSGFSMSDAEFNRLFTPEKRQSHNIRLTHPNHKNFYQYTPEQEEN